MVAGYHDAAGRHGGITLPARPEPIAFAAEATALIVIDMQNAYATKGGYLDLAGFDVSATGPVIGRIATAVAAARKAGIRIVWFQNGWDPDYVEAGGPGSPNWHKSNALKTHAQPPRHERAAARQGNLGLRPGGCAEPRARRHRAGQAALTAASTIPSSTALLRSAGIRTLVFTGIATNVCVESTLRDGFFLEYFGIVLADATHQAGPGSLQAGALANIETFFGWVSDVASFETALGKRDAAAAE